MFIFIPAWRFETPQQVQFVEKLSDVVIGQLPNFWKLWISYVNGSLFSEVNTWAALVSAVKILPTIHLNHHFTLISNSDAFSVSSRGI